MAGEVTFDVVFLGLKDPSGAGRAHFCATMAEMTDRGVGELEAALLTRNEPLFSGLDPGQVRALLDALDRAGALVEIRPRTGPAAERADQPVTVPPVTAPIANEAAPSSDEFQFGNTEPEHDAAGGGFTAGGPIEPGPTASNGLFDEAAAPFHPGKDLAAKGIEDSIGPDAAQLFAAEPVVADPPSTAAFFEDDPPPNPDSVPGLFDADTSATIPCPSCGAQQKADREDCDQCGAVFAKFERQQIQEMQRERHLQGAVTSSVQVREEWVQKAKKYVESHPLPADAIRDFESVLSPAEVPFLQLKSEQGPLLLTSLRLLSLVEGAVVSIPFEMIADVDVGGGLIQKRNRVRMVLSFHAPFPLRSGPARSLTWQLDKDSASRRDVVMDWAFARTFLCGSCGERQLDYRLDRNQSRARCMLCATDHAIDLDDATLEPLSCTPENP